MIDVARVRVRKKGQKEGLIINRRQQRRFESGGQNAGVGLRAGAVECAATATATAATAVHCEGGLRGVVPGIVV